MRCVVRLSRAVACCLLLQTASALPSNGQPAPPAAQAGDAAGDAVGETVGFSTEQLDALLAPIALYPDPLLTQLLMAATFPLQVVAAARWIEDPAHRPLAGDALSKALEPLPWDPSVKSLVPFTQVLAMMNGNLEWMQQLGYAFADQQTSVMDSVQRLRRQAQVAGSLQTTPQQVVTTERIAVQSAAAPGPSQEIIAITPAQPGVVFVPQYSPAVAFGAWPYTALPPVFLPPPPGYAVASAVTTGLAFGAAVAVTASLWNWATPNWGRGNVNVNVNRFNAINVNNVNRSRMTSNVWQPNRPNGRPAGLARAPVGPVGAPRRGSGLPPGAIGRRSVSVPANLVNRPNAPGPGRPGGNLGQNRPGAGQNRPGAGAVNRPGAGPPNRPAFPNGGAGRPGGEGRLPANPSRPGVNRPNAGQNRPANLPARGGAAQRPNIPNRQPGAFAGMSEGRQAPAFAQRGAQSRNLGGGGGGMQRPHNPGGGARGGGGGRLGRH